MDKFARILAIIISLYGCNSSAGSTCSAAELRNVLLKTEGDWIAFEKKGVDEKASAKGIFAITDISVQQGEFWVQTYRAEFFPSKLDVTDNKLLVSNLMFLRALPGGKNNPNNQSAFAVAPYASDSVTFSLRSASDGSCMLDRLILDIENISPAEGRKTESLVFIRK